MPRPLMINTDIDKIINSDEVQSVIRPTIRNRRPIRKKNPLKNFYAMVKLNPNALAWERLAYRKKVAKEKIFKIRKKLLNLNQVQEY